MPNLPQLRDQARRCDAADRSESDWEQTAHVDLLTRDVMSVDVQVSYFCGGPHPDEEYRPLTYNLRTGKRFDSRAMPMNCSWVTRSRLENSLSFTAST